MQNLIKISKINHEFVFKIKIFLNRLNECILNQYTSLIFQPHNIIFDYRKFIKFKNSIF